jgi:Domain of unknown function (DUF3854)
VLTVADLPAEHAWCNAAPGLLFPWRSSDGRVVMQYRPDVAPEVDGRKQKYRWVTGEDLVIHVHPDMADRLPFAGKLVVVEGTKQHLAAVTAVLDAPDVAVVGIAGCYGWLHEGTPIDDMGAIPWVGKNVTIIFDADVATNAMVWGAAKRLGDELRLRGAATVGFV